MWWRRLFLLYILVLRFRVKLSSEVGRLRWLRVPAKCTGLGLPHHLQWRLHPPVTQEQKRPNSGNELVDAEKPSALFSLPPLICDLCTEWIHRFCFVKPSQNLANRKSQDSYFGPNSAHSWTLTSPSWKPETAVSLFVRTFSEKNLLVPQKRSMSHRAKCQSWSLLPDAIKSTI